MAARPHTFARAALGIALAVLLGEVVVRTFYDVRVHYEPGIGYVTDEGRARFGTEGRATTTWLAHGVRYTPGVPSGSPSDVLVLGDSFTEAMMLPDDATFVALAQQRLGAAPIRLVNAGRSRASAADYVALAPRLRGLFAPRWTVAELRSDDLGSDAFITTRPHFVKGQPDAPLAVDPTPEAPPTGFRKPLAVVRRWSMLFQYGYIRGGQFRAVPEPPLFRAGAPRRPSVPEPTYPVEEELDLLVRAWDGRLTILYLSDVLQPDRHETRVRAFCAARALSCVFTRTENEALLARGSAPTGFTNTAWGSGHLNADGHAVAGRLLGEELARLTPRIGAPSPLIEP